MPIPNWIRELFQTIDTNDPAGFASFLTDDVSFVFGNAEPVRGKEAAREAVASFLSSIKGIRHEVFAAWEQADAVTCHGQVTYTRHDTSQLSVPFANVFKMREGLIQDYLIYVDASELYKTEP